MTLLVIKYIDKRTEAICELIRQGSVGFDPRPNWLLVGLPIGKTHKEVKWIHPEENPVVWIKQFISARHYATFNGTKYSATGPHAEAQLRRLGKWLDHLKAHEGAECG